MRIAFAMVPSLRAMAAMTRLCGLPRVFRRCATGFKTSGAKRKRPAAMLIGCTVNHAEVQSCPHAFETSALQENDGLTFRSLCVQLARRLLPKQAIRSRIRHNMHVIWPPAINSLLCSTHASTRDRI